MTVKELDKIAKKGLEMPKGLASYEQSYYIASRGLYMQYAKGEITVAQAREEKKEVLKAYEEGKWEWNYFMQLHRVLEQLKTLKEEGFNSVLEFEILETIDALLHKEA